MWCTPKGHNPITARSGAVFSKELGLKLIQNVSKYDWISFELIEYNEVNYPGYRLELSNECSGCLGRLVHKDN
ncbi:Hypothetical protein HVR_LOCUS859 [uncultured virus]|nr:Hypothetical protein HVR_LOCUS859 [uncultured virus]